jgi:hypothetical protein
VQGRVEVDLACADGVFDAALHGGDRGLVEDSVDTFACFPEEVLVADVAWDELDLVAYRG